MDRLTNPTIKLAFEFLDLQQDYCTYKQAYDRYRQMAKLLHPDKGGNSEIFNILQESWEILRENFKNISNTSGIAYFLKSDKENEYIRLLYLYYAGGEPEIKPYINWVSYIKDKNTFILNDKIFQDEIPISEKEIVNGVTHKCMVIQGTVIKKYALRVQQTKDGQFIVFTEKGE